MWQAHGIFLNLILCQLCSSQRETPCGKRVASFGNKYCARFCSSLRETPLGLWHPSELNSFVHRSPSWDKIPKYLSTIRKQSFRRPNKFIYDSGTTVLSFCKAPLDSADAKRSVIAVSAKT